MAPLGRHGVGGKTAEAALLLDEEGACVRIKVLRQKAQHVLAQLLERLVASHRFTQLRLPGLEPFLSANTELVVNESVAGEHENGGHDGGDDRCRGAPDVQRKHDGKEIDDPDGYPQRGIQIGQENGCHRQGDGRERGR